MTCANKQCYQIQFSPKKIEEMKKQHSLKEIMTANPLTVKTDTKVSEVIKLMSDYEFDHLPVLDDENILQGIISKSDLYRNALRLSKSTSGKSYTERLLSATKAKEIMTANPVVIQSTQSLDFAIELLLQDQFHALPILQDDQLIGIITSKDILESLTNIEIEG